MTATRRLASAIVGSLLVVGIPAGARADGARTTPPPQTSLLASGSIHGVVQDDRGIPVAGAVVSALGATTTTTVTNETGRFELPRLAPGPYRVRARCTGFLATRATVVQVTSYNRSSSTIAMRRIGSTTISPAGIGDTEVAAPDASSSSSGNGGRDEVAWRLRHARRGVLRDVTIPDELLSSPRDPRSAFVPANLFEMAVGTSARAATSFFAATPFSGQVNFLTTGSFDTPSTFFSTEALSRNIAYVRVGAPVGEQGSWNVRGAVTQADIASWIVAGSYGARTDNAAHQYNLGLSYGAQRYDAGSVLAVRDNPSRGRSAGILSGSDTFEISPALTLEYGVQYARYDYLEGRGLVSPRAELTIKPAPRLRLNALATRSALAPGAEEFLAPSSATIWLPPQRTFSSLSTSHLFEAERTTHAELGIEADLGRSTIGARAFRQRVNDQLVTIFGADVPGQPAASLGHYFVGNSGDANAIGYAATFRAAVADRVHGSLEYATADAQLSGPADLAYLILWAPSAAKRASERIHDLTVSVETAVPETATRILVLYRVGNGFAGPARDLVADRSMVDSRFDVQVHQSLPFMNFSSARWEMLVAVRNFFREDGREQSVYDERLVIHPPKRVVGGVSLRF
jgi:hypothetical protein